MNAKEIKESINEIPDNVLEEVLHSKLNMDNISGGKIGEKGKKALMALGGLILIGSATATGFMIGRDDKREYIQSKIKCEKERRLGETFDKEFKIGLALQARDYGDDLNKYKPKVELGKLSEATKELIKYDLKRTEKIFLH